MGHANLKTGLPLALLGVAALIAGWMVMQRPARETPPLMQPPVATPPHAALPASGQVVQQPAPVSAMSVASPATSPPPLSIEAARDAARSPDRTLSPQQLEDRSWAISALAGRPSAESARALVQVLDSSSDYRERLEAVSALHGMAAAGVAPDVVRQALESAAADRNPEVAARARRALGGD
jgi:HEAT repeat protein